MRQIRLATAMPGTCPAASGPRAGSYTRRTLAAEERERGGEPGAGAGVGERPHPRMRRAPFGYRRGDVDAALAARDAELAELRQDIAALWLAFAQHDRLLRGGSPEPASNAASAEDRPERPPEPDADQAAARAAAIGAQLSELDHVLSAIEEATRTLERTYATEIGEPSGVDAPGEPPTRNDGPEPEDESADR